MLDGSGVTFPGATHACARGQQDLAWHTPAYHQKSFCMCFIMINLFLSSDKFAYVMRGFELEAGIGLCTKRASSQFLAVHSH
jgi:hypothetical protein